MNTQERQALQDFLRQLSQARIQNKDREAESLILQAVEQQPDAAYLLVQRLLLQEQALSAAQGQIRALQQQLNSVQQSGSDSFLGSDAQWGRSGNALPRNDPYPYSQRMADGVAMPAARPGLMNSGMGSFLGSMAGVAAGVAAGSFLYNGIEHLLHQDHNSQDAQHQGLADLPTDGDSSGSLPFQDTSGIEDIPNDLSADGSGTWSDDPGDGGGGGGDGDNGYA